MFCQHVLTKTKENINLLDFLQQNENYNIKKKTTKNNKNKQEFFAVCRQQFNEYFIVAML